MRVIRNMGCVLWTKSLFIPGQSVPSTLPHKTLPCTLDIHDFLAQQSHAYIPEFFLRYRFIPYAVAHLSHTGYFTHKHSLHHPFQVFIPSRHVFIYYFICTFSNTNRFSYFLILYSITSYSNHYSKVILCFPYFRPLSLLRYHGFISIHQSLNRQTFMQHSTKRSIFSFTSALPRQLSSHSLRCFHILPSPYLPFTHKNINERIRIKIPQYSKKSVSRQQSCLLCKFNSLACETFNTFKSQMNKFYVLR